MSAIDQATPLAYVHLTHDDESCVLQLYWSIELDVCNARLEFREGTGCNTRIVNAVVVSLPERGLGFISAFVAAFVAQKVERDNFKLMESTLYKQTNIEIALDLCGTQPSSAIEGDAVFFEASRDCEQGSQRQNQEPKGQTSIQEIARFFHMPINQAGGRLGICPTVLKKICRKHGLSRWPHRKLRSIDRLLEKLRASVEQADKPFGSSVHTRNLRDRISDLIRERQDICFEAHQHQVG